jgi:hypothetical protein
MERVKYFTRIAAYYSALYIGLIWENFSQGLKVSMTEWEWGKAMLTIYTFLLTLIRTRKIKSEIKNSFTPVNLYSFLSLRTSSLI